MTKLTWGEHLLSPFVLSVVGKTLMTETENLISLIVGQLSWVRLSPPYVGIFLSTAKHGWTFKTSVVVHFFLLLLQRDSMTW